MVVVFVALLLLAGFAVGCKRDVSWFSSGELDEMGLAGLKPVSGKKVVEGSSRSTYVQLECVYTEFIDFSWRVATLLGKAGAKLYTANYNPAKDIAELKALTLTKDDIEDLVVMPDAMSMVDFFYTHGKRVYHAVTIFNDPASDPGSVTFSVTDMTDDLAGVPFVD
jgi:hypothetical protein